MIGIISLVVSGIALLLATVALYVQSQDRPRIQVVKIRPCASGTRNADNEQWIHRVSSIEVTVVNHGKRAAYNCRGAITFNRLEGLSLHPVNAGSTVDHDRTQFGIEPGAEITLVAAWRFSPDGVIGGPESGLEVTEFFDRGLPATATLAYGSKTVTAVLSEEEGRRQFDEQQERTYLGRTDTA